MQIGNGLVTVLLASCSFVFGGCSLFESSVRRDEVKHLDSQGLWVSYDATRRGALMLPKSFDGKILSEQLPDAVMTSTFELLNKVSTGKLDAENSVKVAQTVTELGKVTASIKFLREALYRLNEAAINKSIASDDYLTAMKEILNLSVAMETTKQLEATRDILRDLQEAKVLNTMNAEDVRSLIRPGSGTSSDK